MKKITVKYSIEIPNDHIDKICRLVQCGKRDLEIHIKQMAEVAGRDRVYQFTQSLNQVKNKGDKANGNE